MSPRPDRRSMFQAAARRTGAAASGDAATTLASSEPLRRRRATVAQNQAALLRLASTLRRLRLAPPVTLPGMDSAALDDAEVLALSAAEYGYPGPAIDRLGRQVAALPTARHSDPSTSRAALSAPTLRNQAGRLLLGFYASYTSDSAGGATSEEAAVMAGVSLSSEYSKRTSDLKELGYVAVVIAEDGSEVTRKGAAGRPRLVFALTESGVMLARQLARQMERSEG